MIRRLLERTLSVLAAGALLERTLSVALALGALPAAVHAQVRVGPEFQVNSVPASSSAVAADAAGNFLVVWLSGDGSDNGVFGRWHDPAGVPLGAAEFRVNATTAGNQVEPAVASAPGGGMAVTWASRGQDGSSYGVYARRYASAAAVPGPEFPVNVYTTNLQGSPSVAADASGNFVVVWHSVGPDGDDVGVFGRRFDPLGSPRGGEFRINSHTTSAQILPAVASDAHGKFVVAWVSYGQDGSNYGIFAQRYDAAGLPLGGEFRVNAYTTGRQRFTAVASDAQGNFVIVWDSEQSGQYDVWARRYDVAGVPQGDEFRVNIHAGGDQRSPAVAWTSEERFVVVWQGPDGSGVGVFGRHYDSSGTPDPFEFPLNTYTTATQARPAVATDGQGNFVTTWTSYGQAGGANGIFAQRFRPDLIFRDGFEDGTVGRWSSSSSDGGDLSVSPLASLKLSTAGLQGVVDDTAGLFVQDDRPQNERRYRARFYFDPNGFDPGEAQLHLRTRIFLVFSEAPTRRVAALVLRRRDGEFSVRGRARLDDNTQADTPFIPITDGPHVIEIDLRLAVAPTASDGYLVVSVDGVNALVAFLDNHLAEVDFVRMGALSVKSGASGTMYWDEFESRRQRAIGP